jgi:hypothetical protein
MPDYTSFLGLYKPSRTDNLALDTSLANNFTTIDTKLGSALTDDNGVTYNSLKDRLRVLKQFLEDSVGINISHLGAVGDGVASDTPAFQQALDLADSNGSVVINIPKGTYRLTAELKFYSNTWVVCHPEAKIIRDHSGYLMMNGNRSTESNPSNFSGYNGRGNIHISGGIWDGNGVNQPSKASIVHFGHGLNIHFNNAIFKDVASSHHIEFNACKNVFVDKCQFLGHAGSSTFNEAIQLDISKSGVTTIGSDDETPCENVWIENCYFGDSETIGSSSIVRAFGSHTATTGRQHKNIHFNSNIVENATSWAVRLYNYANSTVKNNKFINCSAGVNWRASITGVDTENASGNQVGAEITGYGEISGNEFIGGLGGGRGVELYGETGTAGKVTSVQVFGNSIEMANSGNTYDAICFSFADDCNCYGNTINGSGGSSVNVKNSCFGITVNGNTIRDSGSYGVIVDSSSAYVSVLGNNILRSYRSGIIFTDSVIGGIANANVISGVNGVAGTGSSYNHVRVDGSCQRIAISGNMFRDFGEYVTTHAVYVTSSCLDVVMSGNVGAGYTLYNGSSGGVNSGNSGTIS